jgi:phosphate butyryltransferase
MALKKLGDLVKIAADRGTRRLVVAVAQDDDVLRAVKSATDAGLIIPILVGDRESILKASKIAEFELKDIEIVHEPDKQLACSKAVKKVSEGHADILMKGLVSTGMFVKAILNKDAGLLQGTLLSHVAFFESPYYHKVFCVTDAALNIAPDMNEKAGIIQNAVGLYHSLGIKMPKVAVLAAVETINPKMEATVHAAMLAAMQKRNQLEGCIVDGPLALDNAISLEAARHKGIASEVAGDADILVTPDLNSGNILYKSLIFLGGAVTAAMVIGATIPVVLTSRADSDKSKFLSIALAAATKRD